MEKNGSKIKYSLSLRRCCLPLAREPLNCQFHNSLLNTINVFIIMPAINTNDEKESQAVEYSRAFISAKHHWPICVIGVRRIPNSSTSNKLLTLRSILRVS